MGQALRLSPTLGFKVWGKHTERREQLKLGVPKPAHALWGKCVPADMYIRTLSHIHSHTHSHTHNTHTHSHNTLPKHTHTH